MKFYSIESEQAAITAKHGAFYAFSPKQFEKKHRPDIEYVRIVSGLVCPKANIDALVKELEALVDKKIKFELENNTKKDLIRHELSNHECHVTYDYTDALDALTHYGITRAEVAAEFGDFVNDGLDSKYMAAL